MRRLDTALSDVHPNIAHTQERLDAMSASVTPSTVDSAISSEDVILYVSSGGHHHLPLLQEDPEAIAARIDAQIVGASSFEELMGGTEVLHAQDYLNVPFRLDKVEWRPSDQGTLPFFAVLTIVDADGEQLVMTCGARTVMLKAATMAKNDWLGRWVKIIEDGKTAAGNTPLNLVAANDPHDHSAF